MGDGVKQVCTTVRHISTSGLYLYQFLQFHNFYKLDTAPSSSY